MLQMLLLCFLSLNRAIRIYQHYQIQIYRPAIIYRLQSGRRRRRLVVHLKAGEDKNADSNTHKAHIMNGIWNSLLPSKSWVQFSVFVPNHFHLSSCSSLGKGAVEVVAFIAKSSRGSQSFYFIANVHKEPVVEVVSLWTLIHLLVTQPPNQASSIKSFGLDQYAGRIQVVSISSRADLHAVSKASSRPFLTCWKSQLNLIYLIH